MSTKTWAKKLFAPRTGEIDLQGSINWGSPGWGFSLTGTQTDSTVGGLFGSKMSYTISNTGISATEAFSLDLGVAKADATAANFSMQYVDHALTLHVGLEANFEFGYSEFNLHGHLSLGLDLTTDFHGVNIRGHAEVTGGFTVGLISADFSVLKATVDNNGFAISLPCNNKLRVKW